MLEPTEMIGQNENLLTTPLTKGIRQVLQLLRSELIDYSKFKTKENFIKTTKKINIGKTDANIKRLLKQSML